MAPKGHQKDCKCTVCKSKRAKKKRAVPKAKEKATPKAASTQKQRLERCEVLIDVLCTKMGLNPDKLYEHTKKRAKAWKDKTVPLG